jgi:HPt (histidine-containing phosphotransfer) domain-containing protein
MDEVLDEQRFGDLQRDFPPPVVRDVVYTFIDSTPPIIERLVLAAEGEDHQEVARAAHRLKGGCLAVGAGALSDLAHELESMAKEACDGQALRAVAGRLEQTWMATRTQLRVRVESAM